MGDKCGPKFTLRAALGLAGMLVLSNLATAGTRQIPPPPIIIMPLDEVEPPRDVEADKWNSPYCREWSDGCTQCKRNLVLSKSTCVSISENKNSCDKRFVVCLKQDDKILAKICYFSRVYAVSQGEDIALGVPYSEYIKQSTIVGGIQHEWGYENHSWQSTAFGSGLIYKRGKINQARLSIERQFDNQRIVITQAHFRHLCRGLRACGFADSRIG